MTKLKTLFKWGGLWFLVLGIATYALVFALTGFNDSPLKQKLLSLPWTMQIHAIGGAVALLIGLFQFSGLRHKVPSTVHRYLGRVYGVAVLASGTMGLIMATRADGGLINALGFGSLAVMWIVTLILAWYAIRHRQQQRHRYFITLNYALTWAAVTLRVELPILSAFFGFDVGYQIIAWLCWVPNILLAAWWLQRKQVKMLPA
ncbi:DUF2306 domain-containing protein [Reinekea sp. G2M2-21]|uniref:DUF2306 domain-containing protein n=1 Tax=Reinekea sp. G2M2-21 TaxID=2788942 RepID=UPI0018A94BCE|nr:DUF2306 domain-containing protein [Reinekea sp. G2M2-21]